jgi:hypothetical protein
MSERDYSGAELLDINLAGPPYPLSQSRRPNAGQKCAKCGGVVGSRAITDFAHVWHPECDNFNANKIVTSASTQIANAIELQQPQLGSSGGGAVPVQSKSKAKAKEIRALRQGCAEASIQAARAQSQEIRGETT